MLMCDSEKMGLPFLPPSNEWTQQNIMMINPLTGTAAATAATTTSSSSSGSKVAAMGGAMPAHQDPLNCPRCHSSNTKFCYYNNYSLAQPRHFCRACKRYWTRGGTLRNVPVGGGCRKNKRVKKHQSAAALPSTTAPTATATATATTATTVSSSAVVGAPPQTSSQIRSSSDLISSFFDANLGLNYTSFQPQFSALGFNSSNLNSIQPTSLAMASYGNQGVMANYENSLANSLGLMKGVKVEGGESTNPNSTVESWQVMNSTNPFDQGFSVDSNPSNYFYWSSSADPASSSLAPLF